MATEQERKVFRQELSLDSWKIAPQRFLFVTVRRKEQSKGVIQLYLFKPYDFNYRYRVIATNKATHTKHIVGCLQSRMRGSHRQFKHSKKAGTVTIAGKSSVEVPPGTFNSVLKEAGLKH